MMPEADEPGCVDFAIFAAFFYHAPEEALGSTGPSLRQGWTTRVNRVNVS